MAVASETQERQLARAAVLAMQSSILLARQHPDAKALQTTAGRRCRVAVQAATRERPLVLELHADGVTVAGERVLSTAAHDGPFSWLCGVGIGEIVLRVGITDAAIEALVGRLTAMRGSGDTESTVAALVGRTGLPQVLLRASVQGANETPAGPDWWRLPPPLAATPMLRAFVERDLAANLPALAGQSLLDDLDGPDVIDEAPLPVETALQQLLIRMLDRSDIATAAWLLAQVQHHARIGKAVHDRLQATAQLRADDAWLQTQLDAATRDEVMGLAAFVMQLGPVAAARLPSLANAGGHPFAPLLRELLGAC